MKAIPFQKVAKAHIGVVSCIFILSAFFFIAHAQVNSYNKKEVRPFDLISLKTVLNKNRIDISWSTAHEKNLSHFIIERSFDGINYKDIGIVFSVNRKEGEQTYLFRDDAATMKSSTVYYRLVFMQDDGKFSSSDTKTVQLNDSRKS